MQVLGKSKQGKERVSKRGKYAVDVSFLPLLFKSTIDIEAILIGMSFSSSKVSSIVYFSLSFLSTSSGQHSWNVCAEFSGATIKCTLICFVTLAVAVVAFWGSQVTRLGQMLMVAPTMCKQITASSLQELIGDSPALQIYLQVSGWAPWFQVHSIKCIYVAMCTNGFSDWRFPSLANIFSRSLEGLQDSRTPGMKE